MAQGPAASTSGLPQDGACHRRQGRALDLHHPVQLVSLPTLPRRQKVLIPGIESIIWYQAFLVARSARCTQGGGGGGRLLHTCMHACRAPAATPSCSSRGAPLSVKRQPAACASPRPRLPSRCFFEGGVGFMFAPRLGPFPGFSPSVHTWMKGTLFLFFLPHETFSKRRTQPLPNRLRKHTRHPSRGSVADLGVMSLCGTDLMSLCGTDLMWGGERQRGREADNVQAQGRARKHAPGYGLSVCHGHDPHPPISCRSRAGQ